VLKKAATGYRLDADERNFLYEARVCEKKPRKFPLF
jgi:hypothetical protein